MGHPLEEVRLGSAGCLISPKTNWYELLNWQFLPSSNYLIFLKLKMNVLLQGILAVSWGLLTIMTVMETPVRTYVFLYIICINDILLPYACIMQYNVFN